MLGPCPRAVAGAAPLERRNLLPQVKVFNHKIGSAPTHRPDRTGAEGDEEDENTEHSRACLAFFLRNLKPGNGA